MAFVAGVRGFFVAGTDTGVGKTEVARALLSLLRGAVPLKPIETGCAPEHPEDALALLRASGGTFELDRVCPYRFRLPAAPGPCTTAGIGACHCRTSPTAPVRWPEHRETAAITFSGQPCLTILHL